MFVNLAICANCLLNDMELIHCYRFYFFILYCFFFSFLFDFEKKNDYVDNVLFEENTSHI